MKVTSARSPPLSATCIVNASSLMRVGSRMRLTRGIPVINSTSDGRNNTTRGTSVRIHAAASGGGGGEGSGGGDAEEEDLKDGKKKKDGKDGKDGEEEEEEEKVNLLEEFKAGPTVYSHHRIYIRLNPSV